MSDQTPAETLRKAAALMRERAEKAQPGPWTVDTWRGMGGTWASVMVPMGPGVPNARTGLTAMAKLGTQDAETAEHIASWDPPTALLAADLLDRIAWLVKADGAEAAAVIGEAAAFARLYLGEGSDA